MRRRIAVIGGGASGMMAAITAARNGAEVTIYESKERLGKKILATGNGKCNYTNLYQTDDCYRGRNTEFSKTARAVFSQNDTLDFFKEIGIEPKNKNGYIYPNSEQAASLADAMVMELRSLTVKSVFEKVTGVKKHKNIFKVEANGTTKEYDRVILCTGSCAGMKQTKEYLGYDIVKQLGHSLVPVLPALVQLKCREKWFKTVAGVRTEGSIVLYADGKEVATEKGELLFADYGISGIPVFQVSRYAAEALYRKKKVTCQLDVLPSYREEELIELLIKRVNTMKNRTAEEVLVGLCNHKLNYILLKECNIDPVADSKTAFLQEKTIKKLAGMYKRLTCEVTETNPFSNAQVCAGGVNTEEVNPLSMESELCKGLYMAGELLDVDGTCGGYNLQWAWSSGYVAGLHAAND